MSFIERENKMSELNIFRRLATITDELQTVAKNLNVSLGKDKGYKAVGEVDILNAVKPLEKKHGVYSYPIKREVIESKEMINKYDTVNLFMRIETTYRFVNVDKPDEYIEIISYGDGVDPSDKACGKAMTYADKYALMKAYKISTGEDPDQTASEEHKVVKKVLATAEQIKRIKELFTTERVYALLNHAKVSDLKELTIEQASHYIKAEEAKQSKND